ncbi:MAG: DinB family protein [Dehalococcoidia bacterium]
MASPEPPDDLLARFESGPALVARAFAASPAAMLDFSQDGEWSIRDVLAHLADAELVRAVRVRFILAQPTTALSGFDEGAWHDRLGPAARSPLLALQLYEATVATTAELVRVVGPPALAASAHHESGELLTVQELLERGINHALEHAAQIGRLEPR